MHAVGDKQTGTIRPDFDRSISTDFQGNHDLQRSYWD
jgi:hypothetical protein